MSQFRFTVQYHRVSNKKSGTIVSNEFQVQPHHSVNDLLGWLAVKSEPAARKAYTDRPDQTTGFQNHHRGKWRFRFINRLDQIVKIPKDGHVLDGSGFAVLREGLGTMNPEMKSAEISHDLQLKCENQKKKKQKNKRNLKAGSSKNAIPPGVNKFSVLSNNVSL